MNSFGFSGQLMAALIEGAQITIALAVLSILSSLTVGMLIAVCLRSNTTFFRWGIATYIQIARNTPLLLQLYLIYFGLSLIGYPLPAFLCAFIGITFQKSAYMAEVYRGAIQSVPRQQFEAGRALGMRSFTLYTSIILPQAIRKAVPSLTNQCALIVQDTSMAAAISVVEIMQVTRIWLEESGAVYEIFAVVAFVYVVLNAVVLTLGLAIEKLWARGR